MNRFEEELFAIAPWTREVMLVAKGLNQGAFLRGRSGWVVRGLNEPESIYEHSCKLALAGHYLFGSDRAIALGAGHDFAEIYEKDFLPGEVPPELKQELEAGAMGRLRRELPQGAFWHGVWQQYQGKKGLAGHMSELDKICPVVQACIYSQRHAFFDADEFYNSARRKVATPTLAAVLDTVHERAASISYERYFSMLEHIRV